MDTGNNVLTMPDQFEVKSLGSVMKEVFERDLKKFCKQKGIDFETLKPIS